MINITCKHCNQEVEVAMYFSQARIVTLDSMNVPREQYSKAMVNGKAICPLCGKDINEVFHREIHTEDIIKLAGGK